MLTLQSNKLKGVSVEYTWYKWSMQGNLIKLSESVFYLYLNLMYF